MVVELDASNKKHPLFSKSSPKPLVSHLHAGKERFAKVGSFFLPEFFVIRPKRYVGMEA